MLFPYWFARYTPFFRKAVNAMRETLEILNRKVDLAVAAMEDRGGLVAENSGVLAKMMQKCGKDSKVPAIMAVDALGAGVDTTGNTAAFLLYHLASNADKQERLYQELTEVLGPAGGQLTEAKLAKLRYLKACVKESQRMLPVVVGTSRRTQV